MSGICIGCGKFHLRITVDELLLDEHRLGATGIKGGSPDKEYPIASWVHRLALYLTVDSPWRFLRLSRAQLRRVRVFEYLQLHGESCVSIEWVFSARLVCSAKRGANTRRFPVITRLTDARLFEDPLARSL